MDDTNQHPQGRLPTKQTSNCDTNPDDTRTPEKTDSQGFHVPEELELPNSFPPMSMPDYELQGKFPNLNLETPPQSYPQLSKPLKSSLNRMHFSPSTGKTPRSEKEVVSELLTILVDCMKELNTRSRESLLRKFFSEIESDERLEKFIVDRLKQSKVKAISDLFEKLPADVQGQIGNFDTETSGTVDNEKENDDHDSNDSSMAPSDGIQIPKYLSEHAEIYDTSSVSRSIIESVDELSQELERFKIRTLDIQGGVAKEEKKD